MERFNSRFLLNTLIFLFIWGCNPTKQNWEKVKALNTIDGYKQYITKYPDNEFAKVAVIYCDSLEWKEIASNIDSLKIENYLFNHPGGKYAVLARQLMDSLESEKKVQELILNKRIFTDARNNRTYRTYMTGSQIWMAENLDVASFLNGDPIPEVKSSEEWENAYRDERAAWCYYDNNSSDSKKYGRLYNWYAVKDPRGLAPKGWHIPTNNEWQLLISSSGGKEKAFSILTSLTGFNAGAGGERYYKDCSFYKKGEIGFWWTATKQDSYNAWYHAFHFGYSQVGSDNGGMNTGFSVRCVKN